MLNLRKVCQKVRRSDVFSVNTSPKTSEILWYNQNSPNIHRISYQVSINNYINKYNMINSVYVQTTQVITLNVIQTTKFK